MSSYPSIVDYSEVVQHPKTSFTNSLLRTGTVRINALGLPLALSGGFALTYEVTTPQKKFAVRCFHRQVPSAEQKYASIAACIRQLASNYFVDFKYEPTGILVKGSRYPIVSMDWVEGPTLGMYLESHHKSKDLMEKLLRDFQQLSTFLEAKQVAHGDIQNGNVIITRQGIKLIDYDGMYVPGMEVGTGSETGHKHFQHPDRDAKDYGPLMDRFSFIVLDVSLRAVMSDPALYVKFNEGGETIVFKANDYLDPASSPIFKALASKAAVKEYAERLAKICLSELDRVPSLNDYLAGQNIPKPPVVVRTSATTEAVQPPPIAGYVSPYELLASSDYERAESIIGSRVELIGRIEEVSRNVTRRGRRPYVFVNFGDYRGKILKLNIWDEGLKSFASKPGSDWKGKWVSVVGLLDAPYSNAKIGYTHISITITHSNQINFITEKEAGYRLASKGKSAPRRNLGILDAIRSGVSGARSTSQPTTTQPRAPTSSSARSTLSNQAILQKIRGQGQSGPATTHTGASAATTPARGPVKAAPTSQNFLSEIPWWVWVIGIIVVMAMLSSGDKKQKTDRASPSNTAVPAKPVVVQPPVAQKSSPDVVQPPVAQKSSPDPVLTARLPDSPKVEQPRRDSSSASRQQKPAARVEESSSSVSSEEMQSIRRACAGAKRSGADAYTRCLSQQGEALDKTTGAPDLSKFSQSEQQSMAHACRFSRNSGPASYYQCLDREVSALQKTPAPPDVSKFSQSEQQSMVHACRFSRNSGPASYYQCLHREVGALQKTPAPPELSKFSQSEQQSMAHACRFSKNSGPASYYECLWRQTR